MEDSLGKLVSLVGRHKPVLAGNRKSVEAQILMFTGVRYERGLPPSPTDHRSDPSRPRRKRG
jgi:hypothetical protein